MRNLLRIDGPVFQFLSRVFDLMLANILFIVCSIPIVTVGASLAALHKITQDIVFDEEEGVCRRFFQTFTENFKQSTVVWLLMVVFFAGMIGNYLLILTFFKGGTAILLKGILMFLIAIMLSITFYMFPLMVRYNNTLPQHFRNAVVLSVIKLPKTLLMLLINTIPFWILYFSMIGFIKTLVFWLAFGCAFLCYMNNHILKPVFDKLEEVPEEDSDEDEDDDEDDEDEDDEEDDGADDGADGED